MARGQVLMRHAERDALAARMRKAVQQDPSLTTRELMERFGVSRQTVVKHVTPAPEFHPNGARLKDVIQTIKRKAS